jgi:mRNA interferase RelE/StbE
VPKYTVQFVRSARKDLERLPDAVLQRVFPRIEALADTPRPAGCRKLRGAKDLWRIRVGDYRVVYQIDDGILLVEVRTVGDRKDVYG